MLFRFLLLLAPNFVLPEYSTATALFEVVVFFLVFVDLVVLVKELIFEEVGVQTEQVWYFNNFAFSNVISFFEYFKYLQLVV